MTDEAERAWERWSAGHPVELARSSPYVVRTAFLAGFEAGARDAAGKCASLVADACRRIEEHEEP